MSLAVDSQHVDIENAIKGFEDKKLFFLLDGSRVSVVEGLP